MPMPDYMIRCEVVKISCAKSVCPGFGECGLGSVYELGALTPPGMCARAYNMLYPVALAMRFTDEFAWEHGKGYFEMTCPDGEVTFRLSRIKNKKGNAK